MGHRAHVGKLLLERLDSNVPTNFYFLELDTLIMESVFDYDTRRTIVLCVYSRGF
jgi:hypothetical protein